MMGFHSVRRRVKNVFRLRRPLAEYLRGVLAGATVSFTMAETIAYHQVKNSVDVGDLPWYTLDAALVGICVVEAAIAPTLAVLGQGRRRLVLMTGILVPAVLALIALATPNVDTVAGTDICGAAAVQPRLGGVSWRAYVRLSLMVALGGGAAVSRAAVFTNGLLYLDEHEPQHMILHTGLLVAMRVMGLVAIPRALSHNSLGVNVAGCVAPLLLHAVQLLLVPPQPPAATTVPVNHGDTDMPSSFGRVCRSSGVVWRVLAATLLAAALWGFSYHEGDIIKSQYLVDRPESTLAGQAVLIRCLVLILTVVLVAKYNPASETELWNKRPLAKLATMVTLATVPLFVLMVTVARCQRGLVAAGDYSHRPDNCTDCQCSAPWLQLNPVCVTDSVTTYYSPCHAGCTRVDTIGGIQAYSNCSCAATGVQRATQGSCGAVQCASAILLFETLYVLVLALSVSALQCLGVGIVRSAGAGDRGAALGMAAAAVAGGAFAAGHAVYRAVAVSTCAWLQNGRCNLQSQSFAYIVGGVSGALALLSASISLLTWLRSRPLKVPLEESHSL